MTQLNQTPFTVLIRVRYAECDAQEVVFNSRYGDYVDIAITEYMRHLWGGYHDLIKQGFDNQVVKLSTEWTSSAKFDDVIAVSVAQSHIGNTSYSFDITLVDHKTQNAIATSEIVYVLVDTRDYKKTPIPKSLREKMELGVSDIIVDFSGGI